MKKKNSSPSFNTEQYQLPQQDWACGHLSDGHPCPIGPNGSGECIVHQICAPYLDESGWHCTRAKAWGGRCKEGPVPDVNCPEQKATCPHQPVPCQPQRSLRNKRRLVTGITAAFAIGICLVIVGGSSGSATGSGGVSSPIIDTSSIVSPGQLSTHHASLEQGCAACHAAATQSPLAMVSCLFGANSYAEDSQKCLECHNEFGEHALHAHSMAPDRMLEKSADVAPASAGQHTTRQLLARIMSPDSRTETGELACSTCHVEHRGAAFDLTKLTNDQCQSCHSGSFHSFADGHPEFSEPQRAFLYFDHATHFGRHFKRDHSDNESTGKRFSCADCHVPDAAGASMLLADFDNMCADCHADQITDDHMPLSLRLNGAEFFSVGQTELSDLPPFMEVLLLADDSTAETLDAVRSAQPSSDDTGAKARLSQSLEKLQLDLIARREVAVAERLPAENAVALASRLSESGFFVALEHAVATGATATDTDDVAGNQLRQLSGSWLQRPDKTLVYRSRGHADPLLRDWIGFAVQSAVDYPDAPTVNGHGAFDRLLQQLAAPESTGRCMKCHTIDAVTDDFRLVNWKSRQVPSTVDGFTKFVHKPHLTAFGAKQSPEAERLTASQAQCESCHAIRKQNTEFRKSGFVLDDWMPSPDFHHSATIGVNAVTRKSCVKCHTPSQAGDSCLQCHNYHIHSGAERHGNVFEFSAEHTSASNGHND